MEPYGDFHSLSQHQRQGVDYRIRWRMGESGIAILSIHGGSIEPGTSAIAEAIAGSEHSFYAFTGIKLRGNFAMHITSTRFDEPMALEIIRLSERVVSIHGCKGPEPGVYIGGLDLELAGRIRSFLKDAGFQVESSPEPPFGGLNPANICNLCGRGGGVQVEISRGLREQMFRDLSPEGRRFPTPVLSRFAAAVRRAIAPFAVSSLPPPLEGTD